MAQRVPGSVKNKVVATDLLEERANCNFDQEKLRVILHGGELQFKIYKDMLDDFSVPELRNTFAYMEADVNEKQIDMWKRMKYMYEHLGAKYIKNNPSFDFPYVHWPLSFQGQPPAFGLHTSMFWLTIENLSNDEQKARWMPEIRQANMFGCYAQTELGHGSDVASLETTATLDKATDEFVIHSPTLTSTKMWPGDLGRFSTHAIVHSRLIVDGKFHGVHPFLVQLRDLETYKHLKGIKTGDLGPKFGYPTKDNGWAKFDHVRIPRTNLLMGFIDVSKEGVV